MAKRPTTAPHLTAEERDLRLKLHAEGLTNAEIARAVGVSTSAIASWVYYSKLKPNSINGRQDGSVTQRRVDYLNQGYTLREIADLENVKYGTIRQWYCKVVRSPAKLPALIDVSTKPLHERLLLREFFCDLVYAYDRCNVTPDIMRFMYVWSIEKGNRKDVASCPQ